MKNKYLKVSLAVVLVFLLAAVADLIPFWMPDMAEMVALLVVVVLLVVWAGFVMFEHADDEREMIHIMQAGRIAYLSGVGVLTLALLVQGFAHEIDPWIAGALAVMVVSKLCTRIYSELYK